MVNTVLQPPAPLEKWKTVYFRSSKEKSFFRVISVGVVAADSSGNTVASVLSGVVS